MIDHLLTLPEAANLTHLSKRQLFDLNRKGVLPIIRVNARVFRVSESDLESIAQRIGANTSAEVPVSVERGLCDIYGFVPGGKS